ncbi:MULTISPECIES: O-acetyl-ADP-ribose deacetylase [Paenibacillus]|uniref:O-acetyl-ADP-ribose deacetylase n=1 Tax=Paenibacillus TaxID=44249 RepID=UPI0022B91E6C|nr:O-acetyl-ADP-ribose deacetylase [Paenibacillus caseinilyticus]MCZ8523459.1 O-acetyl-ADP-ribose deacetylase [Paenibacillus caseinilyticus]
MTAAVTVGSVSVEVMRGDITRVQADAIVNAANSSLLGGGGVDGAIHRAGGRAILDDCIRIRSIQGGCPPGEAVVTTAGKLPAEYVIHTVGPVWNGGAQGEAEVLKSCYRSVLALAGKHNVRSIAFPNIATGIYGFPKTLAAACAWDEITAFVRGHAENPESLQRVIFVCHDEENFRLYAEEALRRRS